MKNVVAFGNALLDTIVILNDVTLLKKYNLNSDDEKEISPNEMKSLTSDLKSYEQTIAAGGCAQNTLRVLQWLLQGQCSATMFGAIGDDTEGHMLRRILENHGVHTYYVKHADYPTGKTVSLVNGANRSLVACLGAAEMLMLTDVKVDIINKLENVNLVYIEGFFLSRTEVSQFVINHCKVNNKTVAFNLSSEYMCLQHPHIVRYCVENCNIIFGNRKEFEALSSVMKRIDVNDFIIHLGAGAKIVIVTNGSQSVSYVDHRGTLETVVVPSMGEGDILDTTGAGDSFVAGFLAGYLLNKSVRVCTELGCYAAQEIIKSKGCTLPTHRPNFRL